MATANVKPSYQITPPEPFDVSAPKELVAKMDPQIWTF